MTDPSDGPRWAPPGDAEGAPPEPPAPAGDTAREDTVAFATEHTVRVPRTDPPPPPPPPAAMGGWAPPAPPPGPGPSYGGQGGGHGGWQPPPPPSRRTGLVIGIVLGVLGVALVLGLGAALVVRTASGPVDDGAVTTVPEQDVEAPAGDAPDPAEVDPDDVEAQADAVLRTINVSEERMLAFQEVVRGNLDQDGSVGDGAARIAQEAQEAGNDLTALRSDLRSLAGGDGEGFDGLRDIRDTYAAHMGAWIDYLDAVAGSPTLAAPNSSDAESFWRDIETTGEDFVAAVATGLPEDLPASLEDLARFIVERGFGGFDGGGGGDVV